MIYGREGEGGREEGRERKRGREKDAPNSMPCELDEHHPHQ